MKRIYLSGPMTGIIDYNFPAFNRAAADLRAAGYTVVSPAEKDMSITLAWSDYLRADIKALCDCTVIAMLPGWEDSQGAHLEMHVAHRLGIDIMMLGDLLPLDFFTETA